MVDVSNIKGRRRSLARVVALGTVGPGCRANVTTYFWMASRLTISVAVHHPPTTSQNGYLGQHDGRSVCKPCLLPAGSNSALRPTAATNIKLKDIFWPAIHQSMQHPPLPSLRQWGAWQGFYGVLKPFGKEVFPTGWTHGETVSFPKVVGQRS